MNKNIVTIEKLGGAGVSICRVEGRAIFVPYGVPGDTVEIAVKNDRGSYAEAVIRRIVKPSPLRTEPRCPLFGRCGGCDHQNIRYESQLTLKNDVLKEVFRHFLSSVPDGLRPSEGLCPSYGLENPLPSPEVFAYRNKMQMQCVQMGGKLTAGFYERGTKSLVLVSSCPLHSIAVNACASSVIRVLNRNRITAYDPATKKGMVRDIIIRESEADGGLLLTLATATKTLPNINGISKTLFRETPNLKGFYLFHNPHAGDLVLRYGEDVELSQRNGPLTRVYGGLLTERFAGITLTLSPLSFFQVNPPQAENICVWLKDSAESDVACENYTPQGGRLPGLIDAHAGLGTFSLPLSNHFKNILGIELVSHACDLAREHAGQNGIRNFYVKKGDAAETVERTFKTLGLEKFPKTYSHLLLDPPRAGLTPELAGLAASLPFRKIWYVSCNPQTQARDAEILVNKGGYKISRIASFDMFPHTGHMETVMEFLRVPLTS